MRRQVISHAHNKRRVICARDATNKAARRMQQKGESGLAREINNKKYICAHAEQGSAYRWCGYKQAQGCNTSLKNMKKELREHCCERCARGLMELEKISCVSRTRLTRNKAGTRSIATNNPSIEHVTTWYLSRTNYMPASKYLSFS